MLAQMSARDAMLLVDYVVYISTGLLLLHWTYQVNPLVFAEAIAGHFRDYIHCESIYFPAASLFHVALCGCPMW